MHADEQQVAEEAGEDTEDRPAGEDRDGRGPGLIRTSAFAFLAQGAGVVFTAIVTLYLVRALGPASYGIFSLALSIGGFILMPSDFGITSSAQRYIAELAGDRAGVAAVFADALKLKLLISTVVCGTLFALGGVIAHGYGDAALAWPVRGIAIAVFAQTLLTLLAGGFVALGQTSMTFLLYLAESVLETGFTIMFVVLGGGATGAVFGRVAGYVLASCVGLGLIAHRFGPAALELRWSRRHRVRELAVYGSSLVLVDTGNALFAGVDAVLIGALLATSQVGFFTAPMRFVVILMYPAYGVAQAVAPRLTAPEGRRVSRETYLAAFRGVTIFQALLVAPLVVWATPIVHLLLGSKFDQAIVVLQLLAVYVYLSGPAVMMTLSVNYLGAARRRVPITLGSFLVNLIIDLVLLPQIGVKAGAIGTDAGGAVLVLGHLWICTSLIGLDLRALLVTVVRSLLAASAMGAVLFAFGTHALSPAAWVGGLLGGTVAFAAALALTGEVSRTELRALRSAVQARRAREQPGLS